ncbi:MAG: hypothetical protein AVDCRST_MAG79-137, partial [uncultured Thermoleophilia bacterium]
APGDGLGRGDGRGGRTRDVHGSDDRGRSDGIAAARPGHPWPRGASAARHQADGSSGVYLASRSPRRTCGPDGTPQLGKVV